MDKKKMLNVGVISVIETLNNQKVEITELNKNKVKVIYEEKLGLIFSNKNRVLTRVLRVELKEDLIQELASRQMTEKVFYSGVDKLKLLGNKRKSSNYVVVTKKK